jgi:hypothetical protein
MEVTQKEGRTKEKDDLSEDRHTWRGLVVR